MIAKLRNRLRAPGGQFVRSSLLLTVGYAIARVFGLMFGLLLGRVLHTEDYGYIQYSILLAGIIGIGVQPLVQHTLARYISQNRDNQAGLNETTSTILSSVGVLTILTLVITLIIFALTGSFNLGALVIFGGVSLYYTYVGLARGFEDATRLSLVFIASNVVQFVAIVVVYYVLNSRDTLPALLIYGLSYVGPVFYLLVRHPLPVNVSARHVRWARSGPWVRFTLPIWASHTMFALGASVDVFLLAQIAGQGVAGAYAFNRTLCIVFDFLPSALGTLIMPRVAAGSNAARLMLVSGGMVLVTSAAVGAVFLLFYPWVIQTFFSLEYLLDQSTMLIMIIAQSLFGLHGVLSGVVLGQGRASLEFISRVVILAGLYIGGMLLIPAHGVAGMAGASLITAVAGIAVYFVAGLSNRSYTRRSSATA